MKYFAQSVLKYLTREIEAGRNSGKLIFVLPSLPPQVVKDIGDGLTRSFFNESELIIKVAAPLALEWDKSDLEGIRGAHRELHTKGWIDEKDNLTGYRNRPTENGRSCIIVLIGVDRVTDAASMADFHHCTLQTVWDQVLSRSFEDWVRRALDKNIGYEEDTVNHFNLILKALVQLVPIDVLQISTLLQELDLSAAQDGYDAVKVLLASFGRFSLPNFRSFTFSSSKAFAHYLGDALDFFDYKPYFEARERRKQLVKIDAFIEQKLANEVSDEIFDASERGAFATDEEFVAAVRSYVDTHDMDAREKLLACDFVRLNDVILDFRATRKSKSAKETVRKLAGGPIEVALTALWITLREFKTKAIKRGDIASEALAIIRFRTIEFKHDFDGTTASEREKSARAYLTRIIGGVDSFLINYIDTTALTGQDRSLTIDSGLGSHTVTCARARSAEPSLRFSVELKGVNWDKPVKQVFAWRLPEHHPYRVADELIHWGEERMHSAGGFCLPAYHHPYHEELIFSKDDDETRRILLQGIREEEDGCSDLLKATELDKRDPLLPGIRKLAHEYCRFLQHAREHGLHDALLKMWEVLRKAYEGVADAYLRTAACAKSPLVTLLYRAFLFVENRSSVELDRWIWEAAESSGVITVLHPALLEMLQAHILYLLSSFSIIAGEELRSPGLNSFKESRWRGYVDLAAVQTPLTGLLENKVRSLDSEVRGSGLIHRIGSIKSTNAPLTTRLLLRYDAFEDEEISDAELFRNSRESQLLERILSDYRALHPHADDGLSIAVYQNQDIQPLVAAVDTYLNKVHSDDKERRYTLSVTVFTESGDDSTVNRWISQWKERWEAAETQSKLKHYRKLDLSVAHRIVSDKSQFVALINTSLDVDIAVLNGFILAGSHDNQFHRVEPFDVTQRILKFPILEKAFCSFHESGKRLQRARVISNRQFSISTRHAEIMERLQRGTFSPDAHHVILGYGDYGPWQEVINALHRHAEWVVCIDPHIDESLIAEKSQEEFETREIIGFGSGVGTHGESNFTISTEQFRLSDILNKLKASISEVYCDWSPETLEAIAKSILAESQKLSGLSLVRATGIGESVRDFMAYSLVRKLLNAHNEVFCDQLVSLDAFHHWFDSAVSQKRPDLLWLTADISENGRLDLDVRLIECKLAKKSESHLNKAWEQLDNGLKHLVSVFRPRVKETRIENARPDARYWWLQLHRLISSKSKITTGTDKQRVLTALERLAEGDFDIRWRAAALTFWTDQEQSEITLSDSWTFSIFGQEMEIGVITAGMEAVRLLCEKNDQFSIPWPNSSVSFCATHETSSNSEDIDEEDGYNEAGNQAEPKKEPAGTVIPPPTSLKDATVSTPLPAAETLTTVSLSIPDRVLLGLTFSGSRTVFWEFGHENLNNRHLLIFGSSGMGKTYAIQCLLYELGRSGQNSLIMDYTNGFSGEQLEREFSDRMQPFQHVVRRHPLTINPFRQQVESVAGELMLESSATTAQRVSGVFSEVYHFGDQQKSALYQAIKDRLDQQHNTKMVLADLIPKLKELSEQKGSVGQAAASVVSKLVPFIDLNPFGNENPEAWEQIFADVAHRCHIIQLAGFLKDAARLVTEFSLIDLYWFYRARGTQHTPHVIVLDEVQNLDHREQSPLAQLLSEGRKFGFSLILATQIMSNLEKDERDRLFNAAHKLFFRPTDTEIRTYAEIAAVTTGEKSDVWVSRLAALKKGECYSLGPSLNEATGKLETKAFHIRITALGERINRV